MNQTKTPESEQGKKPEQQIVRQKPSHLCSIGIYLGNATKMAHEAYPELVGCKLCKVCKTVSCKEFIDAHDMCKKCFYEFKIPSMSKAEKLDAFEDCEDEHALREIERGVIAMNKHHDDMLSGLAEPFGRWE